jgi:hypothetical protein
MCGGGGSNVTQTQKFEPPAFTTDGSAGTSWQDFLKSSADVNSRPMPQYNMPRVAPINSNQLAGLNMAADRGMNGDPYSNQSKQLGMQTMQGDFLNGNPYLDKVIGNNANNMAQGYAQGTAATNAAMANQQGAFGGSGYTNMQDQASQGLARQIGQMADQSRANNYQFERGQQANAMGMAPQFAAMDWQDIKGLTGSGDAMNSYTQSLLDSGFNQMQEQINYPLQQQERMGNDLSRASGTGGSNSSSMNGGGISTLGGLLGLGTGFLGLKAGGFL